MVHVFALLPGGPGAGSGAAVSAGASGPSRERPSGGGGGGDGDYTDPSASMTTFLMDRSTPLPLFGELVANHFYPSQVQSSGRRSGGGAGAGRRSPTAVAVFKFDKASESTERIEMTEDEASLGSVVGRESQVNLMVCVEPVPVSTERMLRIMTQMLTPTDAVLHTVRRLKADPQSIEAIDRLASVWTSQQASSPLGTSDASAVQSSATPIIFGLILASGNTVWSEAMREELTGKSASHALAWLVRLLQDDQFQAAFNKHIKPLHLRHLHMHLTSEVADVRDVALLFIGQLQRFSPKLQNYTQYIPQFCIKDVTEFLLSFTKAPESRYRFSPATARRLGALIDNHEEAIQLPQLDEAHIASVTNGCILVDPVTGKITTAHLNRLFTDVADPDDDDADVGESGDGTAAAAASAGPENSATASTTPAFSFAAAKSDGVGADGQGAAAGDMGLGAAGATGPGTGTGDGAGTGADAGFGPGAGGAAGGEGGADGEAGGGASSSASTTSSTIGMSGMSGPNASANTSVAASDGSKIEAYNQTLAGSGTGVGAGSGAGAGGGADAEASNSAAASASTSSTAGASGASGGEGTKAESHHQSGAEPVQGGDEGKAEIPLSGAEGESAFVTAVSGRASGSGGPPHPCAEALAAVLTRRERLEERRAEKAALLEKLESKNSEMASLKSALLAKIASSKSESSKKKNEGKLAKLGLKIKSHAAKLSKARMAMEEIELELRSVHWQREGTLIVSHLHSLIDSVARDDDATDIKEQQDRWKSQLLDLSSDVVTASTYVGMVGLMKAGKSSTISGLVGCDICPSRATAMTVIPTIITHVEGVQVPRLFFPPACVEALRAAVAAIKSHLSSLDSRLATSKKEMDDLLELIYSNDSAIQFSVAAICGVEEIQSALVVANDVVRLAEYLGLEGANPLARIMDLHDLPHIEVQFAVMSETGMFGRLSFIDSPGPNEFGMAGLGEVVRRTLKQASIIAVVLNYAALAVKQQGEINEMVREATADLQQEVYMFVNKYDQRNTASGDMDEEQLRDYIQRNIVFGSGSSTFARENIFPVSAKYAQFANTARQYLSNPDGSAIGDDEVYVPDPDEMGWVKDFARIAWGETWSHEKVYPSMLEINDVARFRQGVDAVWRSSRLNEPLESMLRHCYTNAGVISLQQSLARCQAIADSFKLDLNYQIGTVTASVAQLESFLIVSASAYDDIRNAIVDIKKSAVELALKRLPWLILDAIESASDHIVDNPANMLRLVKEVIATLREGPSAKEGLVTQFTAIFTGSEPLSFASQEEAEEVIEHLTEVFKSAASRVQADIINKILTNTKKINYNIGQMVKERLKPHLRQYEDDLERVLAMNIEFPEINAPDLDEFGEGIQASTLKLLEQPTTRAWAVKWLFKFIPVPWLRKNKASTYEVVPARIREAFDQGIRRVFDSTLEASKQLSHVLQRVVDEYGGQVENELNKLISRIRQSIENKKSTHDRSIFVKHLCEEQLWKLEEYYRRARDLAVLLEAHGGSGESEDGASESASSESSAGGGSSASTSGASGSEEEAIEWGKNPTTPRFKRFGYKVSVPKASILYPRQLSRVVIATDVAKLREASRASGSGSGSGNSAGSVAGGGRKVTFGKSRVGASASSGGAGASGQSSSAAALIESKYGGVGVKKKTSYLEFKIKYGTFTVGRELGRGAFATVYAGEYNGRRVAIKDMRIRKNRVDEAIGEVEIMWKLSHPNLVEFLGFSSHGSSFFILMEHMQGGSLRDWFNDHEGDAGAMSYGDRVLLVEDITLGLEHMHSKGVLHRDLKAGNVLLEESEGRLRGKLSDFGTSKSSRTPVASVYQTVKGTPVYMPPELLSSWANRRNKARYSATIDIYALAMIMFELWTTAPLIESADQFNIDEILRGRRPDFPPGFPPSTRRSTHLSAGEVVKRLKVVRGEMGL
ncbi:serine/threonine protein kinase [Thecamonas trahens ATCC 50062]|uniref:Serine/threonine protein kinase n=1 Tax=Thecamonas trahens ATCC 50062 TaxID=461836 RepID=A0A0L0DQU3_THETB|nr:serine/threonine protein kinase [Thecamonas trahens ATCC 50062]KNC54391.1 serine/threonine protein kinase [Thecamonas trahens ATCC 50062]|eukprot:XP_013753690.1 serine/threonine protein kinase [Thecamonas trahens ATCC 50062]